MSIDNGSMKDRLTVDGERMFVPCLRKSKKKGAFQV